MNSDSEFLERFACDVIASSSNVQDYDLKNVAHAISNILINDPQEKAYQEHAIKDFAQELLGLCRKYKINIECSQNFILDGRNFELSIHGSYDVTDPIEIFELTAEKL